MKVTSNHGCRTDGRRELTLPWASRPSLPCNQLTECLSTFCFRFNDPMTTAAKDEPKRLVIKQVNLCNPQSPAVVYESTTDRGGEIDTSSAILRVVIEADAGIRPLSARCLPRWWRGDPETRGSGAGVGPAALSAVPACAGQTGAHHHLPPRRLPECTLTGRCHRRVVGACLARFLVVTAELTDCLCGPVVM